MVKGKVYKFGDDVNTDVIIPARYLNDPSLENMARHCMEDIDPEFPKVDHTGDIMVGGWNFGCGSSREHAPVSIKACGVSCVIAASFARIFYRNAINIGFPILECPEAAEAIANGDTVSVDFETGVIKDETTGESFQAAAFPPFIQAIIEAGGLINYRKKA
ncbi:MAG: 3-isopropylmalate dehydratase small subunit [Clostridiales bacterium]|nr:3-isopropylmalate dehydratase small subunit [Candidatus Crickella merdequi]